MNNEQLEKETFPEENQEEVSIHEDNLMETTEETVVTEEAIAEAVAETEEVVETEEMPKADEEIVEETVEETDEKSEEECDEKEGAQEDMSQQKCSKGNIIFYSILAVMLVAVFGFRIYWQNNFGGVVVDGASMNQTLQSGDKLLMKYLKDVDDLEYGDVIVVKVTEYEEFKDSNTEYLIKRLIAMEGDKVRCTDGQVEICYAGTVEYVLLDEPYAYYTNVNGYDFAEYEVGEDEIFFLGDNRNNSCDSRYKESGGSHLDYLYKESDVYGVVSDWAIENRSWLSKIFFWKD